MIRPRFSRRRLINSSLLLVLCLVTAYIFRLSEISFANSSEWTGWLMVTAILFLLLYAVRKRLSTLPLGRMSLWLQAHIYTGAFAIFVFFLHVGWALPNGWFALSLAISFLGVVVTGLVGLAWSRTLPGFLTLLGDEVLYDRIGGFSISLRNTAEEKILKAVKETGSDELANFYQNTGHAYFSKPHFQWARLYRKYQPRRKIERELNTLRRYLGNDESQFVDEMLELAHKKNLLDAHYTFQGALRYWLFVHLAFSLAIIPLLLMHIVLVYNFTSA